MTTIPLGDAKILRQMLGMSPKDQFTLEAEYEYESGREVWQNFHHSELSDDQLWVIALRILDLGEFRIPQSQQTKPQQTNIKPETEKRPVGRPRKTEANHEPATV